MAYRDLILADGPSLYWPLDSTYGATDQSGNGRNGTGAGGISTGGFSGSPITGESTCTDFDGSNDAISSSYSPYVNATTRTFAGWAYRDASATQDNLVYSTTAGVLFRLETNQIFNFYPDWLGSGTNMGTWPGNTTWVYWALIFNESADTAELFLNGASQGVKSSVTNDWAASPGNFGLGGTYPFDGKMAHFAVWERALTASEIQSHYRAGVDGSPSNRNFVHEAGRGQ